MTGAMDIGIPQLLIALLFIVTAGVASLRLRLGLERDLLWGTLRTVAQLVLMGFVLIYVFQLRQWYLIVGLYTVMILFAAWIIRGRVRSTSVSYFLPTFMSMAVSYLVINVLVVAVIVQADPWYLPKYFIPLGGMIIGNSMNAIAIALDRLFSDLIGKRARIELLISLGATAREASAEVYRDAIRAGMIPSINAMMGVGVVFIPGMMTGQIIAGSDPLVAVKYQIVVMLMLVGSTALGSLLVISLVRRRCFSADHRLTIRERSS